MSSCRPLVYMRTPRLHPAAEALDRAGSFAHGSRSSNDKALAGPPHSGGLPDITFKAGWRRLWPLLSAHCPFLRPPQQSRRCICSAPVSRPRGDRPFGRVAGGQVPEQYDAARGAEYGVAGVVFEAQHFLDRATYATQLYYICSWWKFFSAFWRTRGDRKSVV